MNTSFRSIRLWNENVFAFSVVTCVCSSAIRHHNPQYVLGAFTKPGLNKVFDFMRNLCIK